MTKKIDYLRKEVREIEWRRKREATVIGKAGSMKLRVERATSGKSYKLIDIENDRAIADPAKAQHHPYNWNTYTLEELEDAFSLTPPDKPST